MEYKIGVADQISVEPAASSQKIYLDTVQITMSEGSVAIINVALSDYLKKDVQVSVLLSDPEHRFQPVANSLLIPAGTLSRQVVLQSIDDNIYQGDQTLKLTISSGEQSIKADPDTLIIHLIDNDSPTPIVQLSSQSQNVNENVGTAFVNLVLSSPTSVDVTVPITVTGTATGGQDYIVGTTLPVVIPAGSTTVPINISIIDVSTVEANETVVLTLGTPMNANGPPRGGISVHTMTVIDDDVHLTINDVTVSEDSG